ncbi:MAG: hypothetical protein R3274_02350 [Desulfobacterales bacterium]|nr:hypothetical protein [Desulfobacterales bacterium]
MRKIREFNKKLRQRKTARVEPSVDQTAVDRRSGLADRRKNHTFISDDRRSGIADRRKKDLFHPKRRNYL